MIADDQGNIGQMLKNVGQTLNKYCELAHGFFNQREINRLQRLKISRRNGQWRGRSGKSN